MSEYLFSYGTLQESNVQMELFGRYIKSSEDRVEGYKTSPILIKDESFDPKLDQEYFLIARKSENKEDSIKGVVLELTEEELLLADKYEPEEYKRISVTLASGRQAWIYVSIS